MIAQAARAGTRVTDRLERSATKSIFSCERACGDTYVE
jgi:hypothetical protein